MSGTRSRGVRWVWILWAVCGVVVAGRAFAVPPGYTIEPVGSFPYSRQGNAINALGHVAVGVPGNPNHAYVWTDGALRQLLDSSGSDAAYPWGLNDVGVTVGMTGSWNVEAAVWTATGVTQLGKFGGTWSEARDVNNSGQVVGIYELGLRRSFLWEDGQMTDFGIPEGHGNTQAIAINNLGQIAGETDGPEGRRGFVYDGGQWTLLPSLGDHFIRAFNINDLGDVVGAADNGTACLWSGGQVTVLWSSSVGYAFPYGINNQGQVVGIRDLAGEGGNERHAYLWENGVAHDLNDLLPENSGWQLSSARAVNDSGQITGEGYNAEHLWSVFVMTPIPEPASLVVLALGSLAVLRRRHGRGTAAVRRAFQSSGSGSDCSSPLRKRSRCWR